MQNQIFDIESVIPYQTKLNEELIENFSKFQLITPPDPSKILKKQIELPSLGSSSPPKKTLILDLDETLLFSSQKRCIFLLFIQSNLKLLDEMNKNGNLEKARFHIQIRPYLQDFIESLANLYEIVVYTSGVKEYAEAVVKKINSASKNAIKYVLHRKHCIRSGDIMIKDIRILKNRSPENIVILDNTVLSHTQQLENIIYIPAFVGQENDKELKIIKEFLIKLSSVLTDVRPYVQRFSGVKSLYELFININKNE